MNLQNTGWRRILLLVCSGSAGFYSKGPKESECCPGFRFPRCRTYTNNECYLCFYLSVPGREKGAWPFESAQPDTSCQLKFRESNKRFSTHKLFTFWGCPFAGGNQGGSVFWKTEERRSWMKKLKRLRAPTPIFRYVRRICLVWFLCERDLKDTEVEIRKVKTPCERRSLRFICCIMQ